MMVSIAQMPILFLSVDDMIATMITPAVAWVAGQVQSNAPSKISTTVLVTPSIYRHDKCVHLKTQGKLLIRSLALTSEDSAIKNHKPPLVAISGGAGDEWAGQSSSHLVALALQGSHTGQHCQPCSAAENHHKGQEEASAVRLVKSDCSSSGVTTCSSIGFPRGHQVLQFNSVAREGAASKINPFSLVQATAPEV